MMEKLQLLTRDEKFYIAGFLDGDGSINAQIIRKNDYVLKFQIRLTVTFFQKSTRAYFINWLQNKLGVGSIRNNRNVLEYSIVGIPNVSILLKELQPMLRLKSEQAKIVLQICEALPAVMKSHDQQQFLDLCKLVDRVGELNDSKIRTVTALVVEKTFAQTVDKRNQTLLVEENKEE